MRSIDDNTLNALNGSRPGDTITAYVWRGGKLLTPDPLNVTKWGASWDVTRQVQTFTADVADPSGALVPRLFEDTLGVGGSTLQVRYQVGGAGSVNLGWYRITNTKPEESWRTYVIDSLGNITPDTPIPPGKKLAYVSTGSTITLACEDLAGNIARDRLEAPESPQGASPTIISEITRLTRDIVPVVTYAGVVDRAVNKTLIMKDDRLNSVQDLCKRIACDYRMNGNGQLEVYPITTTAPVWAIHGGPEGVLVSVDWEQNIFGMYNVFIADGTATLNGQDYPIRGRASIQSGALAELGDFCRVQEFYSSTMLTNQADCDAYAVTMRDTFIQSLTVVLNVVCSPNPALQQGDTVLVAAPVVDNQVVNIIGNVLAMEISSNGNTVGAMKLSVVCPYQSVANVFRGVYRGS